MKLKEYVQRVLESPMSHFWSLHGLGMLRLHLTDTRRLNIWDVRYKRKGVSLIHTHPWDFESRIIAGCIRNCRFTIDPTGRPYYMKVVQCGIDKAADMSKPVQVKLKRGPIETYYQEEKYKQIANEIHLSTPTPGTVTIIDRIPKVSELAKVFYKASWGNALCREATKEEILSITSYSLNRWFNGK